MASTILLVDDSSTILDLLSLNLRHLGFKVVTAMDGQDGLEKMAQQPVDLVITDINMPRMDGITFINSLRQNQAWTRIPVIVLSTEKGPQDRQQAAQAGADLYLTKPIVPKELGEHAKKLLARVSA